MEQMSLNLDMLAFYFYLFSAFKEKQTKQKALLTRTRHKTVT